MNSDYLKNGLSSAEVAQRIAAGAQNITTDHTSKTVKQIIQANLFTLFNGLNALLAILVLFTGEYRNMLFMGVVIFNTAIGIFQELRAKRQLDRLRLLSEPHATVIRDGKKIIIKNEEIVKDDLMILSLGNEVLSDCILLEGDLALNESLLTGEANDINKNRDDIIYAGSFVTGGHGRCRVISVGADNYINHILQKAKKEKKQPSKLRDALNFIIKSITIIIIPLGLLLFLKQYFISGIDLDEAIIQTVASMIGMIPEGLILLTSVALSVGALKLSRQNTLTQELYSLETLARTDVICFDKTGTITTGKIVVTDVIKYGEIDEDIIANIVHTLNDQNPTGAALRDYFVLQKKITITEKYPFNSKNKYSGAKIGNDTYLFGAYSYLGLEKIDPKIEADIARYTSNGYRLLALSKNRNLIAIILMRDEIRKEAKDTIAYFYAQGLSLKVISGDDAKTVAHIAKELGIKNADNPIDCQNISDEKLKEAILSSSIFGRVSPDQKSLMIETLKKSGHTVGMVGDGVNDVMALKEADCSIAMYGGADSAKNIAGIVLMDNNFAHMPHIIAEGRRVINNIQRTATLFLIKTVMSILLAILSIFILKEYPFVPIQLTLVSSFCIGMPAFVLTFEPKYEKIKGSFLANILSRAIPSAIAIVLVGLILEAIALIGFIDRANINTMYTLIMASIIIFNIYTISKPLDLLRIALLIISTIGMILAYLFMNDLFYLHHLDIIHIVIVAILALIGIMTLKYLEKLDLAQRFAGKIDEYY